MSSVRRDDAPSMVSAPHSSVAPAGTVNASIPDGLGPACLPENAQPISCPFASIVYTSAPPAVASARANVAARTRDSA